MEGSIVGKELEYAGITKPLPVAGVPIGVKGKLHVLGRNDMSTSQKLGIYWFVNDPEGYIAEEYTDWESWPYTGPGQTHEFISSGQFDLDKLGKYGTWIELLMGSEDNPEVVTRFIGEVCMVVPVDPFIHQFSIEDYRTV